MTKRRRGKKKGTLEWQPKTMMVMQRRTCWGPTAIMINPSLSLTTFLQNWNLVPGAPRGLRKGSSILRRSECLDGSFVAAAFEVDFEVEGGVEQQGETKPLTELVLAECNFRGSNISERMKLYIEGKQPTAALTWENGSPCLLSQLKRQNFMYYCFYFGLTLDQPLSAGIFFGRGNVFRGTFFRVSFLFVFFQVQTNLHGSSFWVSQGCYSLSSKSDSFSEPWRREIMLF